MRHRQRTFASDHPPRMVTSQLETSPRVTSNGAGFLLLLHPPIFYHGQARQGPLVRSCRKRAQPRHRTRTLRRLLSFADEPGQRGFAQANRIALPASIIRWAMTSHTNSGWPVS
jgi:hypothetical protein